jgi:integrase
MGDEQRDGHDDAPPSWGRPKTLAELARARAIPFRTWCEVATRRRRAMRLRCHMDASILRCHIEGDPLGAVPLGEVRAGDLWAWLRRMLEKPKVPRAGRAEVGAHMTPASVAAIWTYVRACLQSACEAGILDVNPSRDVRLPKGRARAVGAPARRDFEGVLEPGEQAALLASLGPASERASAMVRVAMGTGLRRGELLSLCWGDVELGAEPHVTVRTGGPDGAPTKNGRVRRVPLFGLALEALRGWSEAVGRLPERGQLPLFGARANFTPGDYALVFPGKGGVLRHPPASALRLALLAAGIERRCRWHDLRHTCGTSLVLGWWGRTWSPREVQAMLGHSSVTATERYLHARETAVFAAAREMRTRDAQETWPPGGSSVYRGARASETGEQVKLFVIEVGTRKR